MPQVPEIPGVVPQVQPFERPVPLPGVAAPEAAFGTAVSNAVQTFGGDVEKASGEVFSRALALRQLQVEGKLRDMTTDYMNEIAPIQADFLSAKGDNAGPEAMSRHLAQLDAVRQKYVGMAGQYGPYGINTFGADAASMQRSFIRESAVHSATETKGATVRNAESQADMLTRTYANPKNEDEYNTKISQYENISHTLAAANGWSEDDRKDWIFKKTAEARSEQIALIAQKDPQWAFHTLEGALLRKEITQEQSNTLSKYIMAQNRAVGAQDLADRVYSPTKSMSDSEEEVRSNSPDLAHGDPLFERDALSALRHKYTFERGAQREQDNENFTGVYQAIGTNKYRTVAEMQADPQLGPVIDSMRRSQNPRAVKFVDDLQGTLNSHWNKELKLQNDANFNYLTGLTYTNPTQFMDENPFHYQLSDPQRGRIMQMRNAIAKDPNGDPRVTHALPEIRNALRPQLQALGILDPPRRGEDNPEYTRYVGALQSAIDAYNSTYDKPPSPKDLIEIGKRVIYQEASPGVVFGKLWPSYSPPIYDEDIPQAELDRVGQEIVEQGRSYGMELAPDDMDVRREIWRQQFIKLYKKEKPTVAGTPGQS
jgi:hypothetical protein